MPCVVCNSTLVNMIFGEARMMLVGGEKVKAYSQDPRLHCPKCQIVYREEPHGEPTGLVDVNGKKVEIAC